MADTHDRHGSLNVSLGLKAELQAMSDDIGIEVTSVERAYEPEYQAEAIDREGEAGAIGIQKRERWAGNYDVTGSVIDEAKCRGCGACESQCPALPIAIVVEGRNPQTPLSAPSPQLPE